MINSNRQSRRNSQISGISFLSDRVTTSNQGENYNSKIRLSNQEVQSLRSSRQSHSSNKTKKNIQTIQKIFKSIIPQSQIIKSVICQICQLEYNQNQVKQFGTCKHSFCQQCLKQYVKFKINNFQLIMCPLEGCPIQLVKQSQTYQQILAPEEKEKYRKVVVQRKILSNPDLRLCKNQNCQGVINIKTWKTQIFKNPSAIITCTQCKLQYCKQCFEAKHQGACQKDIIKFLQRNRKYRQCSKCKRVIQKTQGCTHMTCLCGYYFCYMCGQQLKNDIHECKIPQHLNCIETIRWQIQHKQMFYESNILSFHRCLYCFELSSKIPKFLRFLYSLAYTLSVYPLSIVLSLVLAVLFFGILFLIVVLIFLFLPISQVCSETVHVPTRFVLQLCGSFGLAITVIIFYPLFVIGIMIQVLIQLFSDQQNCQQLGILFKQVGTGLRNMLLMPLVLCVNPQSLQKQDQQISQQANKKVKNNMKKQDNNVVKVNSMVNESHDRVIEKNKIQQRNIMVQNNINQQRDINIRRSNIVPNN